MMNPRFAAVLVALCGILRSTDLYFRNPVIKSLPVIVLIAWEHLINLTAALPVLYKKRHEFGRIAAKDLLHFAGIGIGASALGILCFTQAFHYINPALAVLLQKLQPVMTIALGVIFLKEKVNRDFILWALLAIVCSYFVSFGMTNPFSGEGKSLATGAAYAVAAAFFWVGGTICGKSLLGKFDQHFVMACRFLVGGIFTALLAFASYGGLQVDVIFSDEQPLFGSVVYMALISGILATSFFYAGLKWVKASLASILELFFPVSSVVIMWWSFNRPVSIEQLIAGLVMFFAVYRINQTTEKQA